jgi:lipopolysaccharide export system permease protein
MQRLSKPFGLNPILTKFVSPKLAIPVVGCRERDGYDRQRGSRDGAPYCETGISVESTISLESPMKLLERYIFRRTLTLSLMTLSATTLMVLITQVLIYVNLLTASGQALVTFFALAATLIPPMLNLVMPFALYIGATQTLNGMNSDSELAVIEAAGGSQSIQTRPIILLAVIMSLVALMLSHLIEPWAYKHKRDIIAKAGADLVRFAVQSGTFQQVGENLFIQIADQLPSGDFGGIFISDSRQPDTDLIYYAKRGTIRKVVGGEIMVLADGEVQRKNPATGELSIIRFESYFLDFNQFGASSGGINYSPKERSTRFLLTAPRSDEFFTRNEPKDIRSEIYRRFSEWLYPMVFGATALYFAVGARSNRQERLWSLTAGVGVAVAVRGAGFFLVNVSGVNSLYAFLNFAIPIGSILLFSTLILMNKSLRFSQAWVDGAGLLGASVARRWTQIRFGNALPQQGPGGPR